VSKLCEENFVGFEVPIATVMKGTEMWYSGKSSSTSLWNVLPPSWGLNCWPNSKWSYAWINIRLCVVSVNVLGAWAFFSVVSCFWWTSRYSEVVHTELSFPKFLYHFYTILITSRTIGLITSAVDTASLLTKEQNVFDPVTRNKRDVK
jgi:hypothetical protein